MMSLTAPAASFPIVDPLTGVANVSGCGPTAAASSGPVADPSLFPGLLRASAGEAPGLRPEQRRSPEAAAELASAVPISLPFLSALLPAPPISYASVADAAAAAAVRAAPHQPASPPASLTLMAPSATPPTLVNQDQGTLRASGGRIHDTGRDGLVVPPALEPATAVSAMPMSLLPTELAIEMAARRVGTPDRLPPSQAAQSATAPAAMVSPPLPSIAVPSATSPSPAPLQLLDEPLARIAAAEPLVAVRHALANRAAAPIDPQSATPERSVGEMQLGSTFETVANDSPPLGASAGDPSIVGALTAPGLGDALRDTLDEMRRRERGSEDTLLSLSGGLGRAMAGAALTTRDALAVDGSSRANQSDAQTPAAPTRAAAATSTPDAIGALVDRAVDQVTEALTLSIREGRTEATISLRPATLGAVKVQIVSGADGLVIRMTAERDAVGELLRGHIAELREALAVHQVAVSELHVLHNPPAVAAPETSPWQDRTPAHEDQEQTPGGSSGGEPDEDEPAE
jgi:flagellar hook-length control protein FliK